VHTRSLVLFFLPLNGKRNIGFTASRKVGNAVVRNRCKRRLRALFAESCMLLGDGSYIFVAKASMNQASYETLKREFIYVLKRTGGLADDKKVSS
jgi:ribonuclease P protein component